MDKTEKQVLWLNEKIHEIVDTCLYDLELTELNIINDKMSMLIEQGNFWDKQENLERYKYDLTQFLRWLCDFIEEEKNDD